MLARAWAPGHITGFFAIRGSPRDPLRRGSIGAGFSVSLGVDAEVRADPAGRAWDGRGGVEVRIGRARAPLARLDVTTAVLRRASEIIPARGRRHELRIVFRQELPVAQGFGVSGASALSLALALADLYDLPQRTAHEIAHAAEIESGTGLGDVSAQIAGGFEARVRPGLPPYGRVLGLGIRGQVVLASLGPKLETRRVLGDAAARRRVNRAGTRAVREFIGSPVLPEFARQSRSFARRTGLDHPPVTRIAAALEDIAHAGQVMLGRSLFAFPHEDEARRVVARIPREAPRWVTRVSTHGCGTVR